MRYRICAHLLLVLLTVWVVASGANETIEMAPEALPGAVDAGIDEAVAAREVFGTVLVAHPERILFAMKDRAGWCRIRHSADAPVSSASLRYCPDDDITVVVLSN